MSSTGDDCYFYYYSTCTKGKDCPFRHCDLALGSEIVCTLWREGLCSRSNCKFRHMESRINRSNIACYWENKPGGCRKPHCVFFHQKFRTTGPSSETPKQLILPTQSSPPQSLPVDSEAPRDSTKSQPVSDQAEIHPGSPRNAPVEPVVVRLNDGEESDTESTTSTPVKIFPNSNSASDKKFHQNADPDEDRDIGIKTLEQLRMEKIHRESEHFYKSNNVPTTNSISQDENVVGDSKNFHCSVYDAPLLDVPELLEQVNSVPHPEKEQKLDTLMNTVKTHCIGNWMANSTRDTSACKRKFNNGDVSTNISCDMTLDDSPLSNDLRDVIQKKRDEQVLPALCPSEPKKRIISLKKAKLSDEAEITITVKDHKSKERVRKERPEAEKTEKRKLDFRIKTLEEIRKEKSKLRSDADESETENGEKSDKEEKKTPHNVILRSAVEVVKPKIKRPAQEIYQVKAKGGLSPQKDSVRQDVDAKKLKLSPKKAFSSVKKVIDMFENTLEKSKDGDIEIPGRRILKLKRTRTTADNEHKAVLSETSKMMDFDAVTATMCDVVDFAVASDVSISPVHMSNTSAVPEVHNTVSNNSKLVPLQQFVRKRAVFHSESIKSLNVESSISTVDVKSSPPNVQNSSMDLHMDDSSDTLPQVNGIDTTSRSDETSTNHKYQGNGIDSTSPETSKEFPSSNQGFRASNRSTSDDLDKLLLAEELNFSIDDLDAGAEKSDDIFLEIDKLLES